ncbi:MAG TPA: filamentous hemagglutinin N-terminal domain-containing protein, partial [Cellvibrio sp.]
MSSSTLPKRFASISRQPQLSRQKLYAAMLIASQWMAASPLWAAPEGGEVVGGEGVITQNGVDTLIHQASDRLAIDWRSFDVAANERVEFIQPSSSSIALNRVLSNSASHILGRIDSNGQVMLVNPNGVVFGKDSIINVGGMIASGMSIDPASFINGDFTLNSLEGTDGKVINYGIINAATGGSVTLVGQQVQNNGLISAKLGAVNLAAGNEAVLTFDPSGLVGVKVTEAVLQQELGVDAAVINNGTINADGGRVLLSASVSEDIFSDAVNNGGMNKTSSVVMHEDGSFTLGAGADVINTGHIDTSVANGAAGKVVVVGNNVTSNGTITANTGSGTAGAIELHSADTTLVTESGAVSAQATTQGHGGDIKVLGKKVGLLDNAQVNASGANGGGQVLIGGDKTGQNLQIRNADFIYLGKDSSVKTDALINGNGGKLITFASDTARIYGNLYSRGGSEGGNGGFIETSGLKGFEILNTPDITATAGSGGTWLIDPYDIVIKNTTNNIGINTNEKTFTSIGTATLGINNITSAL